MSGLRNKVTHKGPSDINADASQICIAHDVRTAAHLQQAGAQRMSKSFDSAAILANVR